MKNYFLNIVIAIKTLLEGAKLTLRHLRSASNKKSVLSIDHPDYFKEEGIVTTEYPFESIPIPDNGRYRLHNEIDDCIVCDLCAKICPVSCIDIEPVKATEEIGKASDGSSIKIWAAKFDIDMAKCCYCGLCTTVCPTECLTMTPVFDYSEFDVKNMTYQFSEMTNDLVEEKKKELAVFLEEKERLKKEVAANKQIHKTIENESNDTKPKPSFKPKVNQVVKEEKDLGKVEDNVEKAEDKPKVKPTFKPKFTKPSIEKGDEEQSKKEGEPKSKPVFKPKFTKTSSTASDQKENVEPTKEKLDNSKIKPVFKPKFTKPVTKDDNDQEKTNKKHLEKYDEEKTISTGEKVATPEKSSSQDSNQETSKDKQKVSSQKPVFRPKVTKTSATNKEEKEINKESENKLGLDEENKVKPKPVFKPKVTKVSKPNDDNNSQSNNSDENN